jgi:hypothetical protein
VRGNSRGNEGFSDGDDEKDKRENNRGDVKIASQSEKKWGEKRRAKVRMGKRKKDGE